MKKVQVSFEHKGQNIYVFANYYKGCPATLEEPAEEPGFEILELSLQISPEDSFIYKSAKKIGLKNTIEFESTEDLAEYIDCNETELDRIILFHIQQNLNYGEYF